MINKITILFLAIVLYYPVLSNWEFDPVFVENEAITDIYFHDEYIFASSYSKVYRYSDAEKTWEELSIDIENVGTIWQVYSYSDSVFTAHENGIIVSVDNGENWEFYLEYKNLIKFSDFNKNDEYLFSAWSSGLRRAKRDEFIFEELDTPIGFSIFSVAVSKENISLVERRTSNGFGGGLLLSQDNGETWDSYFEENRVVNADIEGDSVFTIVFTGLHISSDFGETWNSFSLGKEYDKIIYFDSYLYLLSFDGDFAKFNLETNEIEILTNELKDPIISSLDLKEKNGLLYIATTNGIYVYDPITDELINNSPLKKGGLTFTITKNESEDLLATSYTAGTFVKKDGSDKWEQYSQELDDWSTSISRVHHLDGNPYFLDYNRKRFYYEKSEGDWKEIALNNRPTGFGVGLIEDRFYYNDKQSIYHTFDDGANWENIIGPLDEESGNNWWVDCMSIYYNEIYGGTRNGIYHYSIDEQSWSKMTVADSAADTSSVIRFYQDEDNLFAMIDAYGHKLFEFDEEQQIWNKRVEFDSTNVLSLEWFSDTFFWKSGDKLWMTNDDGMTEIDISEGLDDFDIRYTYDISIIDGFIYIAGNDGVYKRPITDYGLTSVSEDVEARNYLYTFPPYPNPANNSVNVKFYWDISLPMDVSDISIYDLTGNELNVEGDLTINKQEQYYGNLVWDCSEVPTGVYIININHGTEERSVKVIVE